MGGRRSTPGSDAASFGEIRAPLPVLRWVRVMARVDPELPKPEAQALAHAVVRAGRIVDPALLLAIAYQESRWGRNTRHADTHDHGVFGVRVTDTLRPEYVGLESALQDLETNMTEAVSALVFWRQFHATRCTPGEHAWWAHYRWGRIVGEDTDRVGTVYERLKRLYAATGAPL